MPYGSLDMFKTEMHWSHLSWLHSLAKKKKNQRSKKLVWSKLCITYEYNSTAVWFPQTNKEISRNFCIDMCNMMPSLNLPSLNILNLQISEIGTKIHAYFSYEFVIMLWICNPRPKFPSKILETFFDGRNKSFSKWYVSDPLDSSTTLYEFFFFLLLLSF